MSAPEEARAAALAAIRVGMPYVCTMSFDTAGRTMMGIMPNALEDVFVGIEPQPLAIGANCGVGASDIVVSVSEMSGFSTPVVSKGNCGIPKFVGTTITYSGTPELMATYAELAIDAGVRIVGGCCGNSPEHVASMRHAIDGHTKGSVPSIDEVVNALGALTNSVPTISDTTDRDSRRKRGRGES
jgi:5-methyltetrahydrofolate--homocysteine methyltransferase